MTISWNEIKDRALKFSHEWADESSEDAEAKSFWDAFFAVFGVPRRRVATFEQPVKKSDGHGGFIDLLWKGILLVEHKSRGKDLDRAFKQAKDYFPGLKDRDLPRYIIVSDFARFRLYDLEEDTEHEFALKNLYKNVRLFGFVAGYQTTSYKEQDPVNIKAAERMGKLHDRLKAIGYEGHELEVYLVRLLFCLFAEDTSIFERRQFQDLIEQRTATDGQDLAQWLGHLFEVLNTPEDKRLKTLDEQLSAFPYVNGSLFWEHLHMAAFDKDMREMLLECCALDWSRISPAIFGALFQSVMDQKLRRTLGAHYTTEKNILKLIKPLFLDELREEFERIKPQKKRLTEFHERLAQLKFLDPACGCGNFLVIAYRELRELELDILRALHKDNKQLALDVKNEIKCDVDQFYGIEIEEFPAQIAQTALWLMDHQMNLRVSEEFGQYFRRLPLEKSATIIHANALQRDWREIVNPKGLNYILGNPPFGGKKEQSAAQKADMERVFADVKGAGVLDFVAAWYRQAADYMADNPEVKTAFVSTNSITQGEQVGVLWADLLKRGVKIHFAHRTFQWSSEARGKAAVHCVIIGFALHDAVEKRIFDYATVQSEPHEIRANNINPYLFDAPNVLLTKRMFPLCDAPKMDFGSKAADFGHLTLSEDDRTELLRQHPTAASWVRPFIGSEEFINGTRRYCLWLKGISANELRSYPWIMRRIEAVRLARLESNKEKTKEWAKFPTLFTEDRQPTTNYLLIPKVSSERREYVPLAFCQPHLIVNPTVLVIPGANHFHFGVLQSAMHMAWMRSTAGRMKSDYQYSNTIVYNNFPWPQAITDKQKQEIEAAAQVVLDARTKYPDSSLAALYDPLTMPPALVKAHRKLDMAVDAAYARRKFSGDRDRLAFLFELYQQIVSPLVAKKNLRRRSATTKG
jgi:hypothetical protein